MCTRLDSYLKSNNILCTNQFGFLKNSNTDAIVEFLDYVYSSLDKKQSTLAVYLDFSTAFDTVNHEILLSKLQHHDIRGIMLSWFKSYLCNRKQYVSVKNSAPLCQTLHWAFRKARCCAQYFFFCTLRTCTDPQTSYALFILPTIQLFSHPTVTETMFTPQ